MKNPQEQCAERGYHDEQLIQKKRIKRKSGKIEVVEVVKCKHCYVEYEKD